MFKHVIMIQCIDQSDIAPIQQALQTLPALIPELQNAEIGIDQFHSERSFDIVLITTFADEASYHVYDQHPAHVPVKKMIKEKSKAVYAVDFGK